MAATRLIPMHVNKGKTLAQSLGDRTDYAKNPEKTDKGELVTGYQCDPLTVDESSCCPSVSMNRSPAADRGMK